MDQSSFRALLAPKTSKQIAHETVYNDHKKRKVAARDDSDDEHPQSDGEEDGPNQEKGAEKAKKRYRKGKLVDEKGKPINADTGAQYRDRALERQNGNDEEYAESMQLMSKFESARDNTEGVDYTQVSALSAPYTARVEPN